MARKSGQLVIEIGKAIYWKHRDGQLCAGRVTGIDLDKNTVEIDNKLTITGQQIADEKMNY